MSIVKKMVCYKTVVLSQEVFWDPIRSIDCAAFLWSGRKKAIGVVVLHVQLAIEKEETEKPPVAHQFHTVTPSRLVPPLQPEQ
jgi:hypothetical protein